MEQNRGCEGLEEAGTRPISVEEMTKLLMQDKLSKAMNRASKKAGLASKEAGKGAGRRK
jgi:hypothetical protein